MPEDIIDSNADLTLRTRFRNDMNADFFLLLWGTSKIHWLNNNIKLETGNRIKHIYIYTLHI